MDDASLRGIYDERAALAVAEALTYLREHGWQPIDTAPKDGTRVLLWHKLWTGPATGQPYPMGWSLDSDSKPFLYQPTHWMSLPEPPE